MYWGNHVGFWRHQYGHGYFGEGFAGGRWDHDHFMYNRAVMNVNTTVIRNVYEDRTVIVNRTVNHSSSYNGGEEA